MPEPPVAGLAFKSVQGFTAEGIIEAQKLAKTVFVGPVPDSVLWALAIMYDYAKAKKGGEQQ